MGIRHYCKIAKVFTVAAAAAGFVVGAAIGGGAVYAAGQMQDKPDLHKFDYLGTCIDMAGKNFNAVIEKNADGTINCSMKPKAPAP